MTSTTDLPASAVLQAGPTEGQQAPNQGIRGVERGVDTQQAYTTQLYGHPQAAFTSPPEMAQPQAHARPGPYNMGPLANALPQQPYRQGPVNPSQMRYNPSGASPSMLSQAQSMHQYSGQGGMAQVPNQAYYMQQQQPQMSPYYALPISPSQPQSSMSPRTNMSYYGNQPMANQQSHSSMGYYYPQMTPFHSHGQPPHNQAMVGAYMPIAGSQPEMRGGLTQIGDGGNNAAFATAQEPKICKFKSDAGRIHAVADGVQYRAKISRMLCVGRLESLDRAVRFKSPCQFY